MFKCAPLSYRQHWNTVKLAFANWFWPKCNFRHFIRTAGKYWLVCVPWLCVASCCNINYVLVWALKLVSNYNVSIYYKTIALANIHTVQVRTIRIRPKIIVFLTLYCNRTIVTVTVMCNVTTNHFQSMRPTTVQLFPTSFIIHKHWTNSVDELCNTNQCCTNWWNWSPKCSNAIQHKWIDLITKNHNKQDWI